MKRVFKSSPFLGVSVTKKGSGEDTCLLITVVLEYLLWSFCLKTSRQTKAEDKQKADRRAGHGNPALYTKQVKKLQDWL